MALYSITNAISSTTTFSFTYLFNILIQTYTVLASYPGMAVILPFIVRFRTVIDYRLTHEFFHLNEKAERHSYFQGLVTTSLNAYFATVLVSILLGQPVSTLLTSTPLYLTWVAYTLLWFIPIRALHTLSYYFRWIPAVTGIIYEYLLCIFTIERAMQVSYQSQPSGAPFSSTHPRGENISPTDLLGVPSALSIPFAILSGFLVVQGNALLGEMINLHGNFRVKTPTQVKNPFFGTGKLSLNIALLFVIFVVLFTPAHIFLKGAKNAPANLLPIIQIRHDGHEMGYIGHNGYQNGQFCIAPQQKISQVCYHDWMLSWCPDHIPKDFNGVIKVTQNGQPFSSSPPRHSTFYNELICDLTLSMIHLLGLKDCDHLEHSLLPVPDWVQRQHDNHKSASQSITASLHETIMNPNTDNKTIKPKHGIDTTHLYPTIPIDQVGQPILARLFRETIGSRINFYRREMKVLLSTVGYSIGQISMLFNSMIDYVLPVNFISHLQPEHSEFICTPLGLLSTVNMEKKKNALKHNQGKHGSHVGIIDGNQFVVDLLPSEAFTSIIQSSVPPDTLFFVHVPVGDNVVNIYPITFTLIKAFLLLLWFLVHFFHMLVYTKFQSKCGPQLTQIWTSGDTIITKGIGSSTPLVLLNSNGNGGLNRNCGPNCNYDYHNRDHCNHPDNAGVANIDCGMDNFKCNDIHDNNHDDVMGNDNTTKFVPPTPNLKATPNKSRKSKNH